MNFTRFRAISLITICIVLVPLMAQPPRRNEGFVPPRGMVPDEQTAFLIAEAVLTPIYGKQAVEYEKPFHAELVNGVWIVDGARRHERGGSLRIEISKKYGCIQRVFASE